MACASDTDCDNGLFCDGVEPCTDGFCAAGTAPDCADTDACTADSCDEDIDSCVNEPPDVDGDGHSPIDCGGDDCDDGDANRFPGNVEVCDSDNHDEDCDPASFGNEDRDGDGYFDARCCNTDAAGAAVCGDDCDDVHTAVHPSATETCDGFDNNCDGETDEGVSVSVYPDTDFDGHGDDSASAEMHCADAVGFSVLNDDCDDTNPTIYTGQVEICDALDNDCDGVVDDSPIPVTWYADSDGDGFGSAASGSMVSCAPIPGYTLTSQDCDDADAAINPAAAELCDGKDNNCAGGADYRIGLNDFEDDDADGIVDIGCGAPLGVDCDDGDPLTGGGQPEVCDGRDNNCNGEVDEGAMDRQWFRDADGDGYGSITSGTRVGCMPVPGFLGVGGDCNDADPARHPGAAESCNGVDDDCDGSVDGSSADAECVVANAAPACISGRCRVDRCTDGFGDCDGDPTNGCEVTLSDTADHCGSCDTACAPGHGSASCALSSCVFGACDAGYADCDADESNGCETATTADTGNCGGCGTVCDYPGASASCVSGACAMDSCDFGFDDCNADPVDGCEVEPSSDPMNCGRCGVVCDGARLHTTAIACSFGRCAIDDVAPSCEIGWADCDANPFNGCETPTDRDPNNCGGCGMSCDVPGGLASCSGSTCVFNRCEPGFDDCDGDTGSFPVGNGCETPVDSDPANCGGCGMSCGAPPNASGGCFFGRCGITSCAGGFEDCDGIIANGCEAGTGSDPNNCGGCGVSCRIPGASSSCSSSTCGFLACDPGWQDCNLNATAPGSDGCEANTSSDAANCGACGNACRDLPGTFSTSCDFGRCNILSCAMGFEDCDRNPNNGCEASIDNDVMNCGFCGNDCMRAPNVSTATCALGNCSITSCTGGRADCDGDALNGCEADTNSDAANCGTCGTQCVDPMIHVDTGVCVSGGCRPIDCTPGWDDCDGNPTNGCERDVQNDATNCGGCGNDCTGGGTAPASTCTGGTCNIVCPPGQMDCDGNPNNGCEALTDSDLNNCGGCGTFCRSGAGAVAECTGGSCGLLCPLGLTDCDGQPDNGCEADRQNDPMNCGTCSNVCPSGPGGMAACNLGGCALVCDPGFDDCDVLPGNGCEVDLQNDPMDCGFCGNKCILANAVSSCNVGSCQVSGCNAGFGNCDGLDSTGCETPTNNDPLNCGGCGISCGAAGVCNAGVCDGTIDVSVGVSHTCAVRSSGAVVCWGDNSFGQIGVATTVTSSNVPVDVGLAGMRSVSAGGRHSCAVSASSGDVYCWGDDSLGALGSAGGDTTGTAPAPVDRTPLAAGEGFIEVAAGMSHTCAVTNQNNVYCWGDDTRGSLGDGTIGTPAFEQTPVLTSLGGTAQPTLIASGEGFSCVFDLSVGNVKCWGAGDVGQLGNGSLSDSAFPAAVAGAALSGATQVSAGLRHACARDGSGGGKLYCWGENTSDAITAAATTPNQVTPFQISLTFADQVLPIDGSTCGLTGGNLYCWGDNFGNHLGVSAVTDPQPNPAPLSPSFSPASLPSQGGLGGHLCALVGNGVKCWGDNSTGQLGLGFTGGTVTSPGQVVGLMP